MRAHSPLWVIAATILSTACVVAACEPESTKRSATTAAFSTEQGTVVDFPLALGNTWVYSGTFYQGFNQDTVLTATYTVTETVVDVLSSELKPHRVFQIARSEEVRSCPDQWLEQPENWCARTDVDEPTYHWYAVDESTLYHQRRLEIYQLPERSIREMVFPLAEGEAWYLTTEMAETYPDQAADSMLRKVEEEGPRELPSGAFEACFRMTETIGGSGGVTWYCSRIGIVERSTDHRGTPFGSREVLIDYAFPR